MESETIITLIIAAGSALATAIAFLFRMIVKLFTQQVAMSEKIGKLEGNHEGVERLSARVLQVVHDAKKCDECQKDDD